MKKDYPEVQDNPFSKTQSFNTTFKEQKNVIRNTNIM